MTATPRRSRARRFAAALAAATGIGVALIDARPGAAATPWLTVSDGYASFTVPANYVRQTMGTVSLLVVEGNFGPSFNWSELGLTQFGNVWTATIGPLAPGLYYYRLTGDDTTVVKDPTNPTTVTSQPTWSTFVIPGDAASLLTDVPRGQGGTIATLTYDSDAPTGERSARVWTPPGYDPGRASPYPVLYLQPDAGGGAADWAELGRAGQILDNLSLRHRMAPMVVVMGDGNASDSQRELSSLVRAASRSYHIAHDRAHQAVAAVSTGGARVLDVVFAHPGEFGYVGSFASLVPDEQLAPDASAINAGTTLLRLYTGNVTDPAYDPSYHLMRQLDRAGVRYEFDGVNPDVGHNWKAWQDNLIDFVPRLFRPVPEHGPSEGHQPLHREFKPPAPGTAPTPWLSRDAGGATFVTVETGTDFAQARHVTLWGDWAPGGSWLRVPLTRHGERWRGTVGPLTPWFYYYQFIVDLRAEKDTSNPTSITSEPAWSTFLVNGGPARVLTDVPDGRGGTVETLTYHSDVAGEQRTAYVWTPPRYDPHRPAPYPVLFLQHGSGQSYTDWVEMGRARQILDNEFLAGRLKPMVVVMGNGNVSDFTAELLDDLMPAARARYHISDDPQQQALAGLSMGGFQAYDVLRSHPGEFAYIGTFSAGLTNTAGIDVAAINNGTKLLRVYSGDATDFLYPFVKATLATFDSLGIRYEYAGPTQGPHGWDVWQKNLIDFAPRLFRS